MKPNVSIQSEALNEQLFEVKDINGITSNDIHRWLRSQVIDDKRIATSNKYNCFSPIDVVWIGIINEMKKLRFTHLEMKAFKAVLFADVVAEDKKTYPALEHYLTQILTYNIPVFIVINYNKKGVEGIGMMDEKDFFHKLTTGEIVNHTAILLNHIIELLLNPIYTYPEFHEMAGLNEEEKQIFQIIRNKTFKTIRITKKDGNIDSIEGTERIDDADRIAQLLKEGNYQNIEIKQQNGKVVSAHRTIRTNFKRNKQRK